MPFTQTLGSRLWHNPGAIGMPANDGTPRGWYSILAAEDGGIDIALHALDYDHAAAAGAHALGRHAGHRADKALPLSGALHILPERRAHAEELPR